jgi:SecD/SecF fusion protein
MGLRPILFILSGILMISGLTVFFMRNDPNNSKFDIEFTGGTSVQITLKEGAGLDHDDVQKRIHDVAAEIGNSALQAARVYSIGNTRLQYEITTTETNKTRVTATFDDSGKTVETVTADIRKASDETGISMYNLIVTPSGPQAFDISTSQINKSKVTTVLQEAFGESADLSAPQVDEVVNDAIRQAFDKLLVARDNLMPTIISAEKITDADVELVDYYGGIKIVCALESETSVQEIQSRINDIQFKPDMEELGRFRHEILTEDLSVPQPEQKLSRFVYVSAHPDAGYRELDENEWVRFEESEKAKILNACAMETTLGRVTQIDPSIGGEAQRQALIAIILSLIAIVAYVWIRFGDARYGFAAIAALVHDVCITLGAVLVCYYIYEKPFGEALLIGNFKINLQIIAAFLTIIGYSLNDTIVVFDRIRENRGKMTLLNTDLINNSINQTLSRTLLTSFTTFMVVLVMYVLGGPGLRGFTFALLVGVLVGTYSSIGIAAPILLLGGNKEGSLKS